MIPALLLAFLSGAIALSYEILWYRAFSFTSGSRADTFALMLGCYLVGIAAGSLGVRRYCREVDARGREELLGSLFLLTLTANTAGFFVVPGLAWVVTHGLRWEHALIPVGGAAAGLGAIFPLVSHAWIRPDEQAGRRVSYIYLANILGSASGSLLTGFVLMDHLTIASIHVLLFFLGLGMAALLVALGSRTRRAAAGAAIVVLGALNALLGARPFDLIYEKLQDKLTYHPDRRFAHVVETKSGVVTVNQNAQIFGGGIYDGAFNTSLTEDKNTIIRCYALAELHRAPKEVLMIGLSSGSWGTVIANNPAVERFTIIEINHGYLQLIPKYPAVAGLLTNPKVRIEIDDGRRWMVRNADRKFDMIVANATFHWRSNATNLLSKEFLELIRTRLNPGGFYFYNTTESVRIVRTGCTVFPHSLKIGSFLAVGDSPLELDLDRLRETLFAYPREGGVVLDRRKPDEAAQMERVLKGLRRMIRTRAQLTSGPAVPLVTDDNMGTEWERDYESYH
ncbi:MAG: fused MFS/spermidine synthase [Planctomycetes bacterium]|nr:fused MFS/spermidine synthase [Planctomycetota bacterium]